MTACVTGWGSADTHAVTLNDGRQNTHSSAGLPYSTIGMQDIYNLLSNPPTVDKDKAQWMVPSSYHQYDARSHAAQREHGNYHWFAVDVDKGNADLIDLVLAVIKVLPQTCFVVYASRSSKAHDKKWRVLVPLAQPVPGEWYGPYAASLFDALEHVSGLTLDRTLERNGQLVYLPNRGEHYEYAVQDGDLLFAYQTPTTHGLSQRATAYKEIADNVASTGNTDATNGPFIGQFNSRHQVHEMLERYGYTQKDTSDHWRSPYQQSSSFGTQDRGDHWISLSHSDAEQNLGKATSNGSRYGDPFDLYVHFEHAGNFAAAVASIKQDQYGDASSGCITDFTDDDGEYWDIYPLPDRKPGNGYDAFISLMEARQAAFDREAAQAAEYAAMLAKQKLEHDKKKAADWGGEWLKQVPFKVEPNELEWAAWHAPGIIGQAVREMSHTATRKSLVPLLAGAVAAVSYLTMGKYVLRNRHFVTPSSIMTYLIGGSGSGKSDAMSMFYRLSACVEDHHVRAKKLRDFSSGPAVIDFMANHGASVMLLQNEAGAKRAAGKGDNHQAGVMAETTDIYTAFTHGVEGSHAKTEGKSTAAVKNPCLGALLTSTESKLFSAIDGADAESGWLGRYLFLPLRSTEMNMDTAEDFTFSGALKAQVVRLAETLPPTAANLGHPDVWQGEPDYYHVKRYTEQAHDRMVALTHEFDHLNRDNRRGITEQAVYGRTVEAISRLSFVIGLGQMQPAIDLAAVELAELIARCSLVMVTARMENVVDNDDGSDSSKIRQHVQKIVASLKVGLQTEDKRAIPESSRKLVSFFYNHVRLNADGRVEFGLAKLTRKVKDNTNLPHMLIKNEIQGMLELNQLVTVGMIETTGKRWVYLDEE